METNAAILALAALAQATRLEAFRTLVRRGPAGMAAGDLAEALNVPAATLSFHLKQLQHSGLIGSMREGRSIRYTAREEGIRNLLAYLVEDCCEGQAELCGFEMTPCCPPGKKGKQSP